MRLFTQIIIASLLILAIPYLFGWFGPLNKLSITYYQINPYNGHYRNSTYYWFLNISNTESPTIISQYLKPATNKENSWRTISTDRNQPTRLKKVPLILRKLKDLQDAGVSETDMRRHVNKVVSMLENESIHSSDAYNYVEKELNVLYNPPP